MSVNYKKQQERNRLAYQEALAHTLATAKLKDPFKVGEEVSVKGIKCVVIGVSPTHLKLKFVEKADG